MKIYMYENTYTQELENAVESDKAKPLIEEMFYRYGLKVMGVKPYPTIMKEKYWWNNNDSEFAYPNVYMMTLDGLNYCAVFASVLDNDKDVYGAIFHRDVKDRYSNTKLGGDRSCLTSNKISMLLKNIESRQAMPTKPLSENIFHSTLNALERQINGSYYKSARIDGEDLHVILNAVINRQDVSDLPKNIKDNIATALLEYNKIDMDRKARKDSIKSFFYNDVYMIGSDKNDGYVIGKVSVMIDETKTTRGQPDIQYEIITPFRRVMNLDDYEDKNSIIPIMTMLKLKIEGDKDLNNGNTKIRNNYFFEGISELADKDLNVAVINSHVTSFDCQWILIPTESDQ